MEDYENSLCCLDAENNYLWTKDYLYRREQYPKENHYTPAPDISHLHQDWWMFDDIPF